jgi:hypothetical protein
VDWAARDADRARMFDRLKRRDVEGFRALAAAYGVRFILLTRDRSVGWLKTAGLRPADVPEVEPASLSDLPAFELVAGVTLNVERLPENGDLRFVEPTLAPVRRAHAEVSRLQRRCRVDEVTFGEAAPPVVVSDEKLATAPGSVALRWLINAVAIAMSLYHMYVAAFGPPEAIIFRGTHLLFALTLVFLLYPTRPGKPAWRLLDFALLALGFGFVLHIFLNYDYFIDRIIYIDELTMSDPTGSGCD